jgi:heme-degrading monooxygenase HmoA
VAVLMENRVENGNTDFYDAVNEKLGVETDKPDGMIVHTAIDEGENGIRIVDVWESREAFESFRDARLLPAIKAVAEEKGVPMEGPPSYEFSEIHHLVTG